MKRFIPLIAITFLCACQHNIIRITDFNVTLDEDNTYMSGEPVRFNFEGEVDNVIFYSGENGSEYEKNGKASVIKNIQNYLHSYEYVWNEPGTYMVTFVGTNCNYMSYSKEIKEMTVTIIENGIL